jgi:hypothetical protein
LGEVMGRGGKGNGDFKQGDNLMIF